MPDDQAGSPFEVRRARPEEFEQIYDTVDSAFGRKRPRELFNWLYLRNPGGIARCWIVVERETGTILKTGAGFPWPIWRGDQPLMGALGGDAGTLPDWQRKGLSTIRRTVRNSHPWNDDFCSISGPNTGSRIVMRKSGLADQLLGRLRGGVALLRGGPLLERLGAPSVLATPCGHAADAFFSLWPGRGPKDPADTGVRVESVRRFTTEFDDATSRHMAWPKFWCPHNSEFLNWRYLDHPGESYTALALLEGDQPEGYAVVRLAGSSATLSEFVVGTDSRKQAIGLLAHAMALARDAGCHYLNFFATPKWRHWGLFRQAGFLPYVSDNQAEVGCKRHEPEVQDINNWQLLPGDRDYH